MNLLHLVSIFTNLDHSISTKNMPHCAYLVVNWHLPSPRFSSTYHGQWEILISTTWTIRYVVIKCILVNWLGLNLLLLTYVSLFVILNWINKWMLIWIHIWKMLFWWVMLCMKLCSLFLILYLLLFLSPLILVWQHASIKLPL